MFEIIGKYNRAQVYANQIDQTSYAQVLQMCNLEALKDSRIRMMPDMHAYRRSGRHHHSHLQFQGQ